MIKIAIHGFDRIGRLTTRAALARGLFTPVAVSDIAGKVMLRITLTK